MKIDLENWSTVIGAMAALASFFISYLVYRQDQPRVDFICYIAEYWGAGHNGTEKCIYFKIVNSGRRPVVLGTIGGDYFRFQPLMLWTLFPKFFQSRSFILNGEKLDPHLRRAGSAITLKESEEISFQFDLPLHYDLLKVIADQKTKRLYIWDNLNRKHSVHWASLRKLKADAKKMLQVQTNG